MHTPPTDEPGAEDGKLQAPKKLLAALKNLPSERVFIPPYVNERILRAAQQQLEKPQRKNLLRWWIGWTAATAAIAFVAGFAHLFTKPDRETNGRTEFTREDINRDGRVDVLDAFALARKIKSGSSQREFDLNGDGVVNQRDSEIIAMHAVKLEKEDRS